MNVSELWSKPLGGRSLWQWGLALLAGALLGGLAAGYRYLPLPSDWQKLLLLVPFGFLVVMLFNNMERLVLFAMAISVPLNLDFSLVISPYGRNEVNMANGRTVVALTELRLSLILVVAFVGYLFWLVESCQAGRAQGYRARSLRFFGEIGVPAAGLILIALVSVFRAADTQLSFFKVAQLTELFLVFVYLANHLRTEQDFRFFLVVLVGALFAESLLMIVQWFTGWKFSFAGIAAGISLKDRRVAGTLGTANTAGGIMSAQLGLVCALFILFTERRRKAFFALCFVAGCAAMITTSSRASWSSFVVLMAIFLIVARRRGWITWRILAGLLLLAALAGAIFYPTIHARLTEDDHRSVESRVWMNRLAWTIIRASGANFFLGVGANNYAVVAPDYNDVVGGSMGSTIQDISVHNLYMLTWAETGLTGLVCFVWLLAAALVKAWKHLRHGSGFEARLALGLGCALAATCMQMMADPYVARPKIIFAFLIIAMIAALDNLAPAQRQRGSHEYA